MARRKTHMTQQVGYFTALPKATTARLSEGKNRMLRKQLHREGLRVIFARYMSTEAILPFTVVAPSQPTHLSM